MRMEQEGLWAGVGWESAARRLFRRLFWGYIWGIHRILMIPQTELPLLIYRTLSKGNILAGVIALPTRCHLFPLSKEFAPSGCRSFWRSNPTSVLAFSGYCRVTSVSVRVVIRSAPLVKLTGGRFFFFFFWSPRGEVRLESGSLTRFFVKGSNSHFSHFHQGRWMETASHFKSWHVNS